MIKKGFTLPDILIAVSVFVLASTALFGLVSTTTRLSSLILHNYEASNFAREGVEIIENIRAINTIAQLPWTAPETDTFWNTTQAGIFSTLGREKKVCVRLMPNNEKIHPTPWTILPLGRECTLYEKDINELNRSLSIEEKKNLLTPIMLEEDPDTKLFIHKTSSQKPEDKSTVYGRMVELTLKPRSLFHFPDDTQSPFITSSHTFREDDILLVTSRTFWIEGGELRSMSLKKIFTRWNTSL